MTISWYGAVEYCNWRSEMEGREPVYLVDGEDVFCDWAKNGFRLPTEAEWEFAARGGMESRGYKFSGSNAVGVAGWHSRNSRDRIHPVGEKQANELGIFDMTGNVWEWFWDWYGEYPAYSMTNPRGPGPDWFRVVRGGSWGFYASYARNTYRGRYSIDYSSYYLGFRMVLPADNEENPGSGGVALTGSGLQEILEELTVVRDGAFRMGSAEGEENELPVHEVRVGDFRIGKFEVTQGLYTAVTGENPSDDSRGIGDDYPVNNVSWCDALRFCNTLSVRAGLEPVYSLDGGVVVCDRSVNGFRLPTEAEWEFAARGGNEGRGYTYAGSSSIEEAGWYEGNSGYSTHPVGEKKANDLGIYDMAGNVREWCWDFFGPYSEGLLMDPMGPSSGSSRVLRGGSWAYYPDIARTAARSGGTPTRFDSDYGFRIILPMIQE